MLKTKGRYKPELQMPETVALFSSTKKLMVKIKNVENMLSLGVPQLILVQCNLVDDQYQQNSAVLHPYDYPNKSYDYLLNVEPSNLVFQKTYDEFDEIVITFADQNVRLLEIEVKVNVTFLINKQK